MSTSSLSNGNLESEDNNAESIPLRDSSSDQINDDVETPVPDETDNLTSSIHDNSEQSERLERTQPQQEEPRSSSKRRIETFEIDSAPDSDTRESEGNHDDENFIDIHDDDELEDIDDMEGLLESRNGTQKPNRSIKNVAPAAVAAAAASRCCATQRIGNTTVFWPYMYKKTGWGIIGPHFLGPPCVMTLLWSASLYFIKRAFHHVGWITGIICILFTLQATYYLIDTAFRDPGIVIQPTAYGKTEMTGERPPPPDRHHRWCDLCQAYQPPTGAHCPDCNVCVAGFDHHCAWMGSCIGHKNYKQFMRFNLTWLIFLSYAVIWVGMLGPLIFHKHNEDDIVQDHQGIADESDDGVNITDSLEGDQ